MRSQAVSANWTRWPSNADNRSTGALRKGVVGGGTTTIRPRIGSRPLPSLAGRRPPATGSFQVYLARVCLQSFLWNGGFGLTIPVQMGRKPPRGAYLGQAAGTSRQMGRILLAIPRRPDRSLQT